MSRNILTIKDVIVNAVSWTILSVLLVIVFIGVTQPEMLQTNYNNGRAVVGYEWK